MTTEEVDAIVHKLLADLMLGLVRDQVTLPQAVKAVDDLVGGITLADDARLELKARLLDHVFTMFKIRDEQRREAEETPDERLARLAKEWHESGNDDAKLTALAREVVAQGYGLRGIREVEETREEWGQRMWDSIKAHLPESLYFDPETEERNAYRIGFLIGYGGERLIGKLLRWLWRLP